MDGRQAGTQRERVKDKMDFEIITKYFAILHLNDSTFYLYIQQNVLLV